MAGTDPQLSYEWFRNSFVLERLPVDITGFLVGTGQQASAYLVIGYDHLAERMREVYLEVSQLAASTIG